MYPSDLVLSVLLLCNCKNQVLYVITEWGCRRLIGRETWDQWGWDRWGWDRWNDRWNDR